VIYRYVGRLIVKASDGCPLAVYEDGAVGEAVNQPSLGDAHDLALKSAISGALKRCAVNLGDQFGLSLYRDGSVAPVVQRSLVAPAAGDDDGAHRTATRVRRWWAWAWAITTRATLPRSRGRRGSWWPSARSSQA
jgi:hypothetical protein